MEKFIDRFFKYSSPPTDIYLPPPLPEKPPPDVENLPSHFLTMPFNFQELNRAILKSKSKSSPGLDKINFKIIQNLPLNILQRLLTIYNKILDEGSFPEPWSNYLTILIPKENSDKCRPIALASCFLKLLERLITNRLNWWLENQMIIHRSQFGFRKNRFCTDSLATLSTEINLSFVENSFTAALFLDVEAAYDRVVPEILINDLQKLGIPWKICKFYKNLISTRNVYFKVNSSHIGPYTFHRGLPQGCVSSPTLYNIYTSKLHKHIHPLCKILQYADDIVIFFSAHNLDECIHILQYSIVSLQNFLLSKGLNISVEKTKFLIFNSNKKRIPFDSHISLKDQRIPLSYEAIFLGILFDCELSWTPHFQRLINKISKTMNIIKFLRGTWWGSHPGSLRILYHSLIRSSLEYGCQALTIYKNKSYDKICKLQNQILRMILGYRISTPIPVMFSELKEPPLYCRFQFLTKKFIIKILSVEDHPILEPLYRLEQLTTKNNTYNIRTAFYLLNSYINLNKYESKIMFSYTPINYLLDYSLEFEFPNIDLLLGNRLMKSPSPNLELKHYFEGLANKSTIFFTDG